MSKGYPYGKALQDQSLIRSRAYPWEMMSYLKNSRIEDIQDFSRVVQSLHLIQSPLISVEDSH